MRSPFRSWVYPFSKDWQVLYSTYPATTFVQATGTQEYSGVLGVLAEGYWGTAEVSKWQPLPYPQSTPTPTPGGYSIPLLFPRWWSCHWCRWWGCCCHHWWWWLHHGHSWWGGDWCWLSVSQVVRWWQWGLWSTLMVQVISKLAIPFQSSRYARPYQTSHKADSRVPDHSRLSSKRVNWADY